MKNLIDLVNIYDKSVTEHGDSYKSLLWPTYSHAAERYKVFSDLIGNGSVLDYGCGCGDFFSFLQENNKNNIYFGVDANEKFIKICKNKFPKTKFETCNFDGSLSENKIFDFIIANGVFTVRNEITEHNMKKILITIMSNLFNYCNIGICVNFKFTQPENKKENLFYISSCEIINIFNNFSDKNLILDNYDKYEYAICLYKKGINI